MAIRSAIREVALCMMPHRVACITLAAMVLYGTGARADDGATPIFSFSGFGTLGLVHSSEHNADFTTSIFKPNGAGYSHEWSADTDSLIAAQGTARFSPQLSAIVQIISEQNYNNTYLPHVEWANVKYQFTPDFSVRAGRVVMPSFLVSDYRKVGYANTWARPPIEAYGLVPITNNDGLEASYLLHFGDATDTIQSVYGGTKTTTPDGGAGAARNQWGIFNTIESGSWTVSIAYHQTHLTLDGLHPFFESFRAYGQQGNAIADKYDCDGKLIPFGTVGANYDVGKWFLIGEWARTIGHCFTGTQTGWYVGGGYRLGKFTPYLNYGQVRAGSNTSDPGVDDPAAAGLNAQLNGILGSIAVQNTVSVGARWDFAKNADFKLQFDDTRLGAGSPGWLSNIQPGFQPGGTYQVLSAVLDFVY